MSDIPERMRRQVVARASSRCEYCALSQIGQEATFHIDHVTPRIAGGPTELDNLALACVSCSLRKGSIETAIDPDTDEVTPVFNPRSHVWSEHFQWKGQWLVPLSAIGRATVMALALNRPVILGIRLEEIERGRHPPPS